MALVGAETPEGARIRQALADRGIPGERVNLFGRTEGEAVLSEYAGEARMIQEPGDRRADRARRDLPVRNQ